MTSPSTVVLKTETFMHRNVSYDVIASVEEADLGVYHIEVITDGKPVVVTYPKSPRLPDGFQATLGYQVTAMDHVSLRLSKGIDAIDHMMATARNDIIRLV